MSNNRVPRVQTPRHTRTPIAQRPGPAVTASRPAPMVRPSAPVTPKVSDKALGTMPAAPKPVSSQMAQQAQPRVQTPSVKPVAAPPFLTANNPVKTKDSPFLPMKSKGLI